MSSGIIPLVSVIVTTKNEERNIRACLESVARQSMPPLEMIVVDNNSTDQTTEIAKQYGAQVYQFGPERSAQRNYGVEHAKGQYILYLDADMRLSQGVLKDCVNRCEADSEISGIYIPEIIVGEGFWIKVRRFERSFYDGTVIDAVRFVPKLAFQKVDGFDLRFTGPEDWDFDKKIRGLGKTVVAETNLEHDEGDFDLQDYLSKKSYYSKGFDTYTEKWGADDPVVRKQLSPWYRFVGVFVEQGKFIKLLEHPILTLGMYYLRFRVGLVYVASEKFISTNYVSSKTNLKHIEENQQSNQKTYYENVYSDQKSEIHFEKNFDDYYVKRLLKKFNLNKESKILEIGCGNGVFTKKLIDLGAHVTAIDISEKAIDSVSQKFEKQIEEGKAVFYCANINEFLRKESKKLYTHIVGGGILHHIQNLSETLKLIENNLQNGGSILFAPEPNASGFYGMLWKYIAPRISSYFDANFDWDIEKGTLNITKKHLNSLLTEAGFNNIQIVPYQVIPSFRLQFLHKINMKLVHIDHFSSVALYLGIYAKSG